jgi:AraC-like DNA-binding protein
MLTLNQADWQVLHENVEWNCVEAIPSCGYWENTCNVPNQLGTGTLRVIEFSSGLEISINAWEDRHDHICQFSEREHEIEICLEVPLAHRPQDGRYTLYGCGIAPFSTETLASSQSVINLSISIEPDLLKTLYANPAGELPPELQPLFQRDDWQLCLRDRKVTSQMHGIVQQILTCPYQGIVKQMYLQGKVLELLALQVELLQYDQTIFPSHPLERKTIDSVYQARDILQASLENPPSVLDLAQRVGVSDRTLRRAFREVFGTTVVGYLCDQRLEVAERMLRQKKDSVAAVANDVGYASATRFAAAFKRKFGITPRECIAGKLSVLG